MTLALWEWRKLFRLKALWAFMALCLAFNLLLVNSYVEGGKAYFNAASAAGRALGVHVDAEFISGLEALPEDEYRDALLDDARSLTDVFDDFDTGPLAEFYAAQVAGSPLAEKAMRWKYGLLQRRVGHLAETDAALDFYAAGATHDVHKFLFGTLLFSVCAEGAVLAMLGTLYLHGCEDIAHTRGALCCTRTGRRLWRVKALAAVPASMAMYALLAAATLCALFTRFCFSGVWSSNVSSGFNYISELFYIRPFITWADFTVAGYLAAFLALGAALTAVFSLLASVLGALVRNMYLAAVALVLLCLGSLAVASIASGQGWWVLFLASYLQPVLVWFSAAGWFTELGLAAALPWQETIATALNLLLFGALTVIALRRFERKDVT